MYLPGDEWKQVMQDGNYWKCSCIGEGNGKWTCDPIPYCKVKSENKPVGSSWIQSGKKCNCVARNDVSCIPLNDIRTVAVNVPSNTNAELGQSLELQCNFNGGINDVVITWFRKNGGKARVPLMEYDGHLGIASFTDKNFASRSQFIKDRKAWDT